MKYIRTKETVCDLDTYLLDNATKKCFHGIITGVDGEGIKIVNQADTIEELCDEFVREINDGGFYNGHVLCPPFKFKEFVEETEIIDISGIYKIIAKYGAIWTDKGLIYVAKMNEKGELELL